MFILLLSLIVCIRQNIYLPKTKTLGLLIYLINTKNRIGIRIDLVIDRFIWL